METGTLYFILFNVYLISFRPVLYWANEIKWVTKLIQGFCYYQNQPVLMFNSELSLDILLPLDEMFLISSFVCYFTLCSGSNLWTEEQQLLMWDVCMWLALMLCFLDFGTLSAHITPKDGYSRAVRWLLIAETKTEKAAQKHYLSIWEKARLRLFIYFF